MFRKLALFMALGAGVSLPLANLAEAAVADGIIGSHISSSQMLPAENVQFFFGGRNYCWYDNGWQGPGFYWCGCAFRTGLGWGGGYGWDGWHGGGPGGGGHMHVVGGPGGGHPPHVVGVHPHVVGGEHKEQ
jgi:hypothetical protein